MEDAWFAILIGLTAAFGAIAVSVLSNRDFNKTAPNSNRFWVALVLALSVEGIAAVYFTSRKSQTIAANLYIKQSELVLREALRGSRQFALDDFHWPREGNIDISRTLASIESQRLMLEGTLAEFDSEVDRSARIFGRSAEKEAERAIVISNLIRRELLDPLKNPPTNAYQLAFLKTNFLAKMTFCLERLDPDRDER